MTIARQREAGRAPTPHRRTSSDVVSVQRGLVASGSRVGHQLVEHAVAVDEDRGSPHWRAAIDSQCPDLRRPGPGARRARARRRPGTTRRAASADRTADRSESRRPPARPTVPPGLPTTPKIAAPASRASSIALTRLTETLCSREPPPTEKTRTASRPARRETLEPVGVGRSPSRRRSSGRSAPRRCRSARSSRVSRACGSR